MSGIHMSEFNYENICRTCLKEERDVISLTPIFDITMTHIEILDELSIMRLKLAKGDGLPQTICNECVDCLMYINTFRKLCEKSQITLEHGHVTKKLVPIEITTQNGLEFNDVEFLHDEHVKLEIQLKEESIPDDSVTCLSDEWNENNLIESEPNKKCRDETGKHMCANCGELCSNWNELLLHQKNICDTSSNSKCCYCDKIFETFELFDNHMKCEHPNRKRSRICPICGKYFTTAPSHKRHIELHNKNSESHNQNSVHQCDICESVFKYKNYLAKHKKSVHTVVNHECPHCFLTFNNTNKYKYHLKTHDPNKKFKCNYCDKSFLQQHHLSNHERVHTGLRPYLCNVCGKEFRQEHNFTVHLRTHNGERPYVCSLCGKNFAQRGSFLLHKRQHAGIRPYQCEHCGKNFYDKSNLNVHLRIHTGERPFKCELCDKSFVQLPGFKYHKLAVHGGLKPIQKNNNILKALVNVESVALVENTTVPIKSENDAEITIDPEYAKVKEKVAAKQFLFKCNLCKKDFKLPSSLATHMKTHSEERKHVCTQCGNSFKRAEHLRIHINGVHLKQKPYACAICDKTFTQTGDRNIHMLAHTGEKPHSCPHCSKRFRLQKALKAHIRIHTGEKPYKCEICNMGFITYNALVVHTVKHPESLLFLAKENCLNKNVKV